MHCYQMISPTLQIRIYYRRWRLNGCGIGHGSCLIRAIDKLCCCKASNGSKRNAPHPNRVPQLKLSYSPTGAQVALLHDANATGGSSTTTASSGGIKSACSDDVSSVTEMMVSSNSIIVFFQNSLYSSFLSESFLGLK